MQMITDHNVRETLDICVAVVAVALLTTNGVLKLRNAQIILGQFLSLMSTLRTDNNLHFF